MDTNYELCEGMEILQGDLIEEFPILIPPSSRAIYNLVILTQSCDIVNKKTSDILVASYNKKSVFLKTYENFPIENMRKGRYFLLKLLPPCEIEGYKNEALIVDFAKIWTVSLDDIKRHVSTNKRIRMMSPLREFLSQAYAISIMRVSFPEEILARAKNNN